MTRAEAAKLGGMVTSAKKASATRRNGRMPCAPGKFRGRPKLYPHFCAAVQMQVKAKAGICTLCDEMVSVPK